MCRNPLQKSQLCIEIKKQITTVHNSFEPIGTTHSGVHIYSFPLHSADPTPSWFPLNFEGTTPTAFTPYHQVDNISVNISRIDRPPPLIYNPLVFTPVNIYEID
jgi:hypothetical protein